MQVWGRNYLGEDKTAMVCPLRKGGGDRNDGPDALLASFSNCFTPFKAATLCSSPLLRPDNAEWPIYSMAKRGSDDGAIMAPPRVARRQRLLHEAESLKLEVSNLTAAAKTVDTEADLEEQF